MNIYQEIVMDDYRHPRNAGELEQADFSTGEHNPSCGDSIALQGIIIDNKMNKIRFVGKGCVISQATASLLTEWSLGKTVAQLLMINKEDIQILLGMPLGPMRIRCALLSLYALQKGLASYTMHK